MRTPQDAIADILKHITSLQDVEEVPLSEACGRILASEIRSDVDLPPFEKAMMDGIALAAEDSSEGDWDLELVGESRAGVGFDGELQRGQAIRIYTGAELCAGADAVVMVERTREEAGRVHSSGLVPAGQHVSHKAEILGIGRTVLSPGHRIDAIDLTLLAAVGADPVQVFRRPRITVLTTGDELVPPSAVPGPGQIREGNTIFLAAAATAASPGCVLVEVGIVPDDPEQLKARFERALTEGDALVTTGGVSMGKYDLVGPCLEAIGVEPILHKVAIKPGKPIWFGKRGTKPVFGLPGNPVSSLLGFEVFVRPALAALGGAGPEEQAERLATGRWDGPPKSAAERQLNLPVAVSRGDDGVALLSPSVWRGSADVAGLASAGGFAIIPADSAVATGELIQWRPFGGCHLA
ncbi:MAG: molybdopterin molybdotransferase MoeA [Planctomycetota bacterium]|nr:molybdopterin molybdotransferase MoeA [Planctomycetota bacterium]